MVRVKRNDASSQGKNVTPDQIVEYVRQFIDAFPDARFEERGMYEDGSAVIVEGVYFATNTGPLVGPDGGTLPATGRTVTAISA